MTLSLRYAALSDLGRSRRDNQDSGFASERLLVVADGVGGAARGDVASATAVQVLRRLDGPAPEDLLEAVSGAIHRTHDRLAELVEEEPELEGTSTTVTLALFDGNRIAVGHVGDSRAYLLRDGEVSRLTKDHTFVQTLVDEGRISEEESRAHPHRNLILRAVDAVHDTEPDLFEVELEPGDRLLLCSDGCSGVLEDSRLGEILGDGTVDYATVELVRAALDAGSSDNITCVVADVVDSTALVDDETVAASTTGPMLVGAAAELPRKAVTTTSGRGLFKALRWHDTGELEPVGTAAEVDPEEVRYAPRPPRRFVWLRRFVVIAVALALVYTAGLGAYRWSQNQYYVAAEGDRVAIFQGVQADLPGLTLHHVYELSDISLATLPEYHAVQVQGGIPADDLDSARDIVARLDELVEPPQECEPTTQPPRRRTGERSPTASPAPSPTASPTVGAAEAPSPGANADPCVEEGGTQ